MEDDYDPSITFEGVRDGVEFIEFTLTPKPDAPVVWGKIVANVKKDGFIPLNYYYYDEDMNVARTFIFSQVVDLAGRPRPKEMKVIPADKPDEYTEIVYDELELDISIDDGFFSLSRLKRM